MKRFALLAFSALVVMAMLLSACQAAAPTASPSTEGHEPAEGYPGPGEETETGYPAGSPESTESGTGAPAAGDNVIVVGTDPPFPPFETVDEATRELTGFDIELMKAIAEVNDWEIEWVTQPFDPLLLSLENCQVDLGIAAITVTDERREVMLFSSAYLTDENAGQVVVVRSGDTTIGGREDLTGKKVGAQLGTTGALEAEKIENVQFTPYDTYELAFQALALGQLDAVIADKSLAEDYLAQHPGTFQIAGEPFTEEYYGIAICKDRTDLVEPINEALQTLIDNGTLRQLEVKWLASESE